ncbi:MAG: DNA-directed RNA polymerase subunit beta' [Acholeplasmatales bacterium]|nr:DNA-directed RNA polymerase subunit beta' [Acholeplasmatales bacterium]
MSKQYKYIKIGLASPEEILSWSHGEVLKHETINYRTLKPEPDGLFCEKIFGPSKDYQCACGKSRKSTDKGKVCEKCGVEITESKVRRERMGHIKLAAPVVHTWFLKNTPSPLATLLDLKTKDVEEIVYLASYIVIDPGKNLGLKKKQVLNEATYAQLSEQHPKQFVALTGAEAIKKLLEGIDLEAERIALRKKLGTKSKPKRDKAIKRLEIVESFLRSDNKPEWMILDVLPVIPPNLRPMVQLEGGRFATTDLNDLYRRILNRNNRLKKQKEQNAPYLIIKNEKRMLQEAVDALIDNAKHGKKAGVDKAHKLKSLSDMLRGKQGRFRQNLLGKRVDYSGRSVIVVGPFLKMYQCGIPKEMALTLFKPFVLRELTKRNTDKSKEKITIAVANRMIDSQDDSVWNILESVVKEHPVLINRAPTLHRLGIQAFEPILIEGKAIRLHPLVCTPFNADFDGDQMAIHVPLSLEAQAEARLLMLASNNILNPRDGKPVVTPSQDMILGNYYLSLERAGEPNEGHFYKDFDEAYMAYKNGAITLHTRIFVDISYLPAHKFADQELPSKYLFTTIGKMIFNKILPVEFPYLNEPTDENLTKATPAKYFLDPKKGYEASMNELFAHAEVTPFKKKFIAKIIAQVFKRFQITETSKMLDRIKDLGYKYSTISGLTISMADVLDYKGKEVRINQAEKKISEITSFYELGVISEKDRKKLVEKEWTDARSEIQKGLWEELSKQKNNAIFMMADSGSRGSASNFAQLAGMRGLMANTAGETIEVPVKANFREGLSVAEFFISTHGARKGSTDTALKTAESGYLTRRLVDVSQNVVISTEDCGTEKGFYVEDILDENNLEGGKPKVIVQAYVRAIGRFAAKDIVNPTTGEIIVKRNELITEDIADEIKNAGINRICIRSNLTCAAKTGVCMKCYGRNLATNMIVEVGEAVGTIAAQSIGEPGTQLTMRTFHNGGVAGGDITQGLPRVQELFEARKPKGKATISEIDGKIKSITNTRAGKLITVSNEETGEEESYTVDATSELLVSQGDEIKRGAKLMKGSIHPKELIKILDAEAVEKYIVEEVQKVYRSQEVEISDKHIEIIVRQMMRKVTVIAEGDTDLLPGHDVSVTDFQKAVNKVLRNGGRLPVAKQLLLGITKAALASDSFLSASSFQETTRVLTQAAIQSKSDSLQGLKENTIIGGLIPAGTGILEEDTFECEHAPEEESIYAKAVNEARDEESGESYLDLINDGVDEQTDFDADFAISSEESSDID